MQPKFTAMDSSNNRTSVFSLKFDENNDEVEIIQETGIEGASGFQNEFYNCIASSFAKADQISSPGSIKCDFPCRKCGKKYKYLGLLNTHYMSCNGRRDSLQVCPTCNKTYKSTMAYKKHLLICFQSNSTPCLVDRTLCFCCEEPTKFAHSGNICCPKCPKSFRSQKGLTRHLMLLHATSIKFKCELCNVQCSNNYILKLHRQSHTDDLDRIESGSPEYKCNLCDKSFLEKTAFDIHVAIHKRGDTTPNVSYKCKLCQIELPSLEAHNSHVCDSLSRSKYKCNLCGKCLSSKGFYQRHINTHKKYNELAESDVNANTETADDRIESKTSIIKETPTIKLEIGDMLIEEERIAEGPSVFVKSLTNASQNIRVLNGTKMFRSDQENEVIELEANENGAAKEMNLESILKCIEHQQEKFVVTFPMDDNTLKESVMSFLKILLDAELLKEFGWPHVPVEKMIVDVLQHLECKPSSNQNDGALRLRENVKLLIEAVVDDSNAIKNSDNIFTIDTVLRDIIKYSS